MKRHGAQVLGLGLQLALVATVAAVIAPTSAEAMLVCTVNADAKNIPVYDRPGGAEVRRVDVDPKWTGGAGLPAHEQDGQGMMEMWVEVKDAAGAVVGFFKLGDGGAGCRGGF